MTERALSEGVVNKLRYRMSLPRLALVSVALGVILALPLLVTNSFQRNLLDIVTITAILSMSYNIILGTAGQVSLSHNAFYAIGAYAMAIAVVRAGLPHLVAIPLSLVACAVAALIVGVPTLRLKSFYLAVATLALSVVTSVVLFQWRPVTGGVDGIRGFGRLDILNWEPGPVAYSYIVVGSAIVVYWLLQNTLRSPFGRATVAVRDNEPAAVALGIPSARQKIVALVVSAVLAGYAGNLYAFREQYLNPIPFDLNLAFLLLFMAVIGGLGSTLGAAIGAVVVVLLPELLSGMGSEHYFLVYGIVTIVMIIYVPTGLVGLPRYLVSAIQSRLGRREVAEPGGQLQQNWDTLSFEAGEISSMPIDEEAWDQTEILRVAGVTKHFGGITAVTNAEFSVERGSITALIGPNGAGKSTLFHIISGALKLDEGEVYFNGSKITGLAPHLIARQGLIRTYQHVSLFPQMTVYENLLTGYHRLHGAGLVSSMFRLPRFQREERKARAVADTLIGTFDLGRWRNVEANNLSFGLQRSVETARALAAAPTLLLLDEPAAGLNDEEVEEFKSTLRKLRDRGISILLIEHNLPLVTDLSDWIVVLDFGEVIAQGTAEEIQQDAKVIEAYVGTGTEKRSPEVAEDN